MPHWDFSPITKVTFKKIQPVRISDRFKINQKKTHMNNMSCN